MLDSIYRLGNVKNDQKTLINSLLTSTAVKYVVGIQFQHRIDRMKYVKSEIFEFQDPSNYLFKRDYSGRPGLFLTGNISRDEIKKIKVEIKKSGIESEKVKKFKRNKILWFPKGKLISDNNLKRLNDYRKNELFGIFSEFKSKEMQISNDVLELLTKDEPERILLTIMIHEYDDGENKDENGKEEQTPKFIGQIPDYVNFFKDSVLSKKFDESQQELYCAICNNKSIIETFVERPFPFFVTDKPMFFPNAEDKQSNKGFPLCDNCYLELQKGLYLIQKKLNFKITAVNSTVSQLRFWLIPHLNDQELIADFEADLDNPDLYLNSLKKLCETLQSMSKHDHHKREGIEAFMRFSALFYIIDSNGMMRISNYIQGIYPIQLEKLISIKEKVDNQYPYSNLRKKFNDFFIGFPIIILFYKDSMPQWQQQVILLLEKLFTSQLIEIEDVISRINARIYEVSTSRNLYQLSYIAFFGLLMLEYFISMNSSNNIKSLSDQQEDNSKPITKDIEYIQKFLQEHQSILVDGASRAIFAIGICIGILLEVQELKYNKTAPFWNRLNRLNVDKNKLKELVPEVKSKLAMYNERSYNTIIDYLITNEVSRIDDPTKVSKEMVNLIFSIGLSFGSMLKRGYLKKEV